VALVILLLALTLMVVNRIDDRGAESRVERRATETTVDGVNESTRTSVSVEVSTPGADTSLVGRALGTGAAPALLQILVAGLAAFVGGAITQRIWLGEYGFTVGPVSLPALAPVSERAATEAVELITESPEFAEILAPGPRRPVPFPQYYSIADRRLELVSIRLELEERLRALAQAAGIDSDIDLELLPGRLARRGVFDADAARGLVQLLELGDRVVAGAEIDDGAGKKVRATASYVLYALVELERRIAERTIS
jgi:hypothetical protein